MGLGDVKLMAAVGAWQGWELVLFAIFLGALVAAVVGITFIVMKKAKLGIEDPLWSISGGWFPDHTLFWLGDLVLVFKTILDRPYSRNGSL